MFKEHNYVIWGTKCQCGKILEINREKAEAFYNSKIYDYYKELSGDVIDLGCGGGFITNYINSNHLVNNIYAIDRDSGCIEDLSKIKDEQEKIKFINIDISELSNKFKENSVDYIVSRDVFMFIEDTEKYFTDMCRIAKKGIIQMGWYISHNHRMKNQITPDKIAIEFKRRGWKVRINYLEWYKSGYVILADR